jgi:hypothetical protein
MNCCKLLHLFLGSILLFGGCNVDDVDVHGANSAMAGQIVERQDPSGARITIAYDAKGMPKSLTRVVQSQDVPNADDTASATEPNSNGVIRHDGVTFGKISRLNSTKTSTR